MANIKEVIARAESLCARLDLHCTQREHRADTINAQQVRENNQLRPFDGGTPAARGDAEAVKAFRSGKDSKKPWAVQYRSHIWYYKTEEEAKKAAEKLGDDSRGDADKDWSAKLRELETAYEYWEEKGNSAKMKEFAEKIKEHKRKRADDAARGDAADTVYKGYLIKEHPMRANEFMISKNGSHIATVNSLAAAKKEIDKLT